MYQLGVIEPRVSLAGRSEDSSKFGAIQFDGSCSRLSAAVAIHRGVELSEETMVLQKNASLWQAK